MKQQFTGVQILRFLAAMLVVVMHTTQAISVHITGRGSNYYWEHGSAGVDIFFVISGFVMAMSVRTPYLDVQARVSAAWVFIKRRLLRIAPLYWFYTFLKAALLLALPGLASISSVEPGHLAASLMFIPAMSPWGLIQSTLPVGWTLNFEMLFYGVFVLAIALGAPRTRFCLAVFLSICVAARYIPDSVPLEFYAQSIVFEFILGVCIAHAMSYYRAIPPAAGLVLVVAGMAGALDRAITAGIPAFISWRHLLFHLPLTHLRGSRRCSGIKEPGCAGPFRHRSGDWGACGHLRLHFLHVA